MSTFGKKALINWDYNSIDYIRYNHTPKSMQLKILKKWYPLDIEFQYYTPFDKEKNGTGVKVRILEYTELEAGWFIRFKYSFITGNSNGISNPVNPLRFKPSKELLREIKLENILKDGNNN